MFIYYYTLLFLASSLAVDAQTTTTTDANGRTVVGIKTTNPQGQTTTTFSTLIKTSTTTTTTQGPGPVAQPAPTTATAGAPFEFTYTTIVNGVTQTVTDTFTPTSPPTSSVAAPSIGTVWAYSSWYSVYGPPKGASSSASRVTVTLRDILAGLSSAFAFAVSFICML